MPRVTTEWISVEELARRTGSSRRVLSELRRDGHLVNRVKPGSPKKSPIHQFGWPEVESQVKNCQDNKRQALVSATRLHFDLTDVNYKDMKSWEKVCTALARGSKNAPDIATAYMKAIEQQAKTRLMQIKAMKQEETVLERSVVEDWAYKISKSNRDIWLNWPQVVSTRMAEELGVPSKKVHDILKKYVVKQLERNAQMPDKYDRKSDD
jgi:hypothetical protein